MRMSAWRERLFMVLAASAALSGCGPRAEVPSPSASPQPGGYVFSSDWFSDRIPLWQDVLADYKGKPDMSYLEIGTFEGRSFFWMLDNILTHPSCRATGIDVFPLDLRQRFDANLATSGDAQRVTTINAPSQIALRTLPMASYDIIYVDGSHAAKDVLADAVLAWPLLRNGGLLILDDYDWQLDWPLEFRPRAAIDAFLTVYRNDFEVVDLSQQAIVRKVEMPAPYILRLGRYAYLWRQQELYRIGEQSPIPASEGERAAIARLAVARGFGEVGYEARPELVADKAVQALAARLDLRLAASE